MQTEIAIFLFFTLQVVFNISIMQKTELLTERLEEMINNKN